MSGTSMAAPATTRLVALLLASAAHDGLSLTSAEIRAAVIDTAHHIHMNGRSYRPNNRPNHTTPEAPLD